MNHIRARMRNVTGGFTLLEVLIVVAIIALLVAVLLPSLTAARRSAQTAHCQANLSQIGRAWHAYLSDSNGQFLKNFGGEDCYHWTFGGKRTGRYPIKRPLNTYMGTPKRVKTSSSVAIFRCPDDQGSGVIRPTSFDYHGNSYRANHLLIGPQKLNYDPQEDCAALWAMVEQRLGKLSVELVDEPSKVLLVGDHGWFFSWTPYSERPGTEMNWHNRPSYHNALFVDGHVNARLTRFCRGVHVAGHYSIIPFRNLINEAIRCQPEGCSP